MFAEDNLKIFDEADKRAKETRHQVRPKNETTRIQIKYPAPYSKFGSGIELSDITEYMTKMRQICTHLEEGMAPESCLVLIDGYKEQFLNYTILSYLGYCKSRLVSSAKLSEMSEEVSSAIKNTRTLAFKAAIDYVRKHNPQVKNFKKVVRHDTADIISYKAIDEISDLFTDSFTSSAKNPQEQIEKAKTIALYCRDLHLEKFAEFLKLLENDLGIPDTASKIPVYFSTLYKRLFPSSS